MHPLSFSLTQSLCFKETGALLSRSAPTPPPPFRRPPGRFPAAQKWFSSLSTISTPPLLLTQDEDVKSFIASITSQLSEWVEAGKLQRAVLVIMSKSSSEVLERWNFNIETDSEVIEKGVSMEKCDKEILREIQAIMRQMA